MQPGSFVVPAASSTIRRINYIILAVVLAVIVINVWLSAVFSGKTILSQQSTVMARAMVDQAALMAKLHIEELSYTGLQNIADNVAKSPHIHDAAIYDVHGKDLAKSETFLSQQQRLQQINSDYQLTPFVSDIIDEQGTTLGYVIVHFLQQDILNKSSDFQNQIWSQLQVMILLAFFIGILASRGFARMRYRKTQTIEK